MTVKTRIKSQDLKAKYLEEKPKKRHQKSIKAQLWKDSSLTDHNLNLTTKKSILTSNLHLEFKILNNQQSEPKIPTTETKIIEIQVPQE